MITSSFLTTHSIWTTSLSLGPKEEPAWDLVRAHLCIVLVILPPYFACPLGGEDLCLLSEGILIQCQLRYVCRWMKSGTWPSFLKQFTSHFSTWNTKRRWMFYLSVSFSQITPQTCDHDAYVIFTAPQTLWTGELLTVIQNFFCCCSIPPNHDISVAGDLYIIMDDKQVFYKECSTIDRHSKWCPAMDDHIIWHPFEPSHQLMVTADWFLQWSKNHPKVSTFRHGVANMSKMISKHGCVATGDSLYHPIEIDID